MIKLSKAEKSELVTNCDRFRLLKHSTSLPYAFTDYGVIMLSSVLNSERAIRVNISIVRAFVRLREFLVSHKDLADKIEALERKYQLHETDIQAIFKAIRKLLEPPPGHDKPSIGFK